MSTATPQLIAAVSILVLSQLAAAGSGPVALSANNRCFLDDKGQPCFWNGDTQWDLFLGFKTATADSICVNRAGQGFSALQVMLWGVGGGQIANAYNQKPLVNNNPLTPNEAYFKVVDTIVDIAARNNQTLVIGVYHWHPDYKTFITMANARAYSKWLGLRYKSKSNIIWSMYPPAEGASLAIVREVAAGLAEGDGGSHLITWHPDPGPISSSKYQNETWISFNTLQTTWSSGFINYSMVAADCAKTPVKAVVNGENLYEQPSSWNPGPGNLPLDTRNAAWWATLAGGFDTYGHAQAYGDQVATTWKTWINSPGAQGMKVLGAFFRSISWWKLTPDQSIISGSVNNRAAARSADGDWVVVYLPAAGSVTVNLTKITAAGTALASWLNPADGTTSAIGDVGKTGAQSFAAPSGWADALLYIRTPQSTIAAKPLTDRAVRRDPGLTRRAVSVKDHAGATVVARERITDMAGRSRRSHRPTDR